MEKTYRISTPRNDRVFIDATPGHFVTSSSHMNYYLDVTDVKHQHDMAVDTAMALSEFYRTNDIEVDTVVCLYETDVLGAYLAHELSRPNMLDPNPNDQIYVMSPEYDANGNMIFRDNLRPNIEGRNILLLISCVTSGQTLSRSLECAKYYGGNVVGVSAIFSAKTEVDGITVDALFTPADVPGYQAMPASQCALCKNGVKIDALVNGFGYSKV